MKIIPIKTEYNFEILKHTAKAYIEHVCGMREVVYQFDDKIVGKRIVDEGELISDDDCIADILSEYCRTNTGVYADIYKNHSDKIQLVNKIVVAKIESGAFLVDITVTCEKGFYTFLITTNEGKDSMLCKMEAMDVSEAFEKARLILYGIEGLNSEVAKHINELANDQIMEIIKWKK